MNYDGAANICTYTLSGNLPNGLSFDASTHNINGILTSIGQYIFVINVVYANGDNGNQNYTVDVSAPDLSKDVNVMNLINNQMSTVDSISSIQINSLVSHLEQAYSSFSGDLQPYSLWMTGSANHSSRKMNNIKSKSDSTDFQWVSTKL